MIDAYPELQLPQPNLRLHPVAELASLVQNRRSLYRRYIECRDGLTRLSPYLADAAADVGRTLEDMTCDEVGQLIDLALAHKPAVEDESVLREPCAVVVGDVRAGFEEDLAALLALAGALPSGRRATH